MLQVDIVNTINSENRRHVLDLYRAPNQHELKHLAQHRKLLKQRFVRIGEHCMQHIRRIPMTINTASPTPKISPIATPAARQKCPEMASVDDAFFPSRIATGRTTQIRSRVIKDSLVQIPIPL